MNICLDCVPCSPRQSLEAARNVTEDTRIHDQIVRGVLRMTAELDLGQVERFRRGWPFLRDRRIDAYDGLLRRYGDDRRSGA